MEVAAAAATDMPPSPASPASTSIAAAAQAFPAPTPLHTPCSAALRQAQRQSKLARNAALQRARQPIIPDVEVCVNDKFIVVADVAALCHHKTLQELLRQLATNRVTCVVKSPSAARHTLGKPRTRLFFHIGSLDASAPDGFRAHMHDSHVTELLDRMNTYHAWRDATTRYTERFDFTLNNNFVVQTLFKPKQPYVSSRVIVYAPHTSVLLPLRQSQQHGPTAVRVQLVDETAWQMEDTESLATKRVCVRAFSAFRDGAWLYRITQCWHGTTVAEAERAKLMSPPRIEVSLELLFDDYPHRRDVAYTIGSALQRVKDMLNQSVVETERVRFTGSVTPPFRYAAAAAAAGGGGSSGCK